MPCRPATDDDAPAIRALRRAWQEEDAGAPLEDAALDAAFAAAFDEWWSDQRDQRRHWVATVDGEVAGMASVVVVRPMPAPGVDVRPWGYVHHVYVRPDARDRGLGSALLGAVVAWSRSERFRQLLLHPRPRSVPFYERAGFTGAGDLLRLRLAEP